MVAPDAAWQIFHNLMAAGAGLPRRRGVHPPVV
jgi:hypothetical protein